MIRRLFLPGGWPGLLVILVAAGIGTADEVRPEPVALRDGDRVVLIGGTFVERDQDHGYLETLLTARYPDRTITFRNLGWSGDNVFGESRAGFGTVEDGYQRRKEQLAAVSPTVILVGYGAAESFEGAAGLPRFRSGLERLLHDLAQTGARIALMSPLGQEAAGPPLPDPARHNADLSLYRDAIQEAAARRNWPFLDLFGWHQALMRSEPACRLTWDGLHLTDPGSARVARALATLMGAPGDVSWSAVVDGQGRVVKAERVRITNVKKSERGLRFEAVAERLSMAGPPAGSGCDATADDPPAARIRFEGLAPGRHVVKVDGRPVGRVEGGENTEAAITLAPDLDREQVEQLRAAIRTKNELFFHRWRPQNETYLFGFRKHEQGQNAREVPRFDPLVAEQESRIAVLRRPAPHLIEVEREEDAR